MNDLKIKNNKLDFKKTLIVYFTNYVERIYCN